MTRGGTRQPPERGASLQRLPRERRYTPPRSPRPLPARLSGGCDGVPAARHVLRPRRASAPERSAQFPLRHHRAQASPTQERGRGLRPRVLATGWALILGFAALTAPLQPQRPRRPIQAKPRGKERLRGLGKWPVQADVWRDALAGLLTACSAGLRGHQADGAHLGRPLAVVVAPASWGAKVSRPAMHHLMHRRAENLFLRASPKRVPG